MTAEESIDLTPGDVWTQQQVDFLRTLIAELYRARTELAALRAKADAADRVRELHQPLDRGTGPRCQGCSTHVTFTPWPCATVRALDGPAPC